MKRAADLPLDALAEPDAAAAPSPSKRARKEEKEAVGREILPKLFLGSAEAAHNLKWLRREGIRRVLNVAFEVPNYHETADDGGLDLVYLKIGTWDNPDQALLDYFAPANDFVQDGLAAEEKVLIHCREGRSRSLSFLAAFLIAHRGFSLAQVEEHMQRIGGPSPKKMNNVGFYAQLDQFNEQLGRPAARRKLI
jgi:atypical dual specificity phosphatase